MLMPKKVKYRKQIADAAAVKAMRGSEVSFGEYGLKALECAWITDRQIEASRVAISPASSSVAENFGFGFSRTSRNTKKPANPHG